MAKDCNYSPITLSGIFKHDDTKSTATILPAAFRIAFRYNTDIGREIEFVIACGKYFSVNFIIGYPFLKNAKALLCFGQGPAQDVPYDLIFWYISKIIYLS